MLLTKKKLSESFKKEVLISISLINQNQNAILQMKLVRRRKMPQPPLKLSDFRNLMQESINHQSSKLRKIVPVNLYAQMMDSLR